MRVDIFNNHWPERQGADIQNRVEEKQVKDDEVKNLKQQMAAMQQSQKELFDMLKEPGKFLRILKAKEKAEKDDPLIKQHSEELDALWWKDENI